MSLFQTKIILNVEWNLPFRRGGSSNGSFLTVSGQSHVEFHSKISVSNERNDHFLTSQRWILATVLGRWLCTSVGSSKTHTPFSICYFEVASGSILFYISTVSLFPSFNRSLLVLSVCVCVRSRWKSYDDWTYSCPLRHPLFLYAQSRLFCVLIVDPTNPLVFLCGRPRMCVPSLRYGIYDTAIWQRTNSAQMHGDSLFDIFIGFNWQDIWHTIRNVICTKFSTTFIDSHKWTCFVLIFCKAFFFLVVVMVTGRRIMNFLNCCIVWFMLANRNCNLYSVQFC